MTPADERPWDVVLFGATGFTGGLAAAWLAERAPAGVRWAIAGRDGGRLAALRASLGERGADPGVVIADVAEPDSVAAMCASGRVVLSTVGPFARHGTPVVEACVAHRTHYCDITGETPWVRSLVDRFHDRAADEGTRIVPMCGYDSLPSDLGAFLVARALRALGQPTAEVRAVHTVKGGTSGGTVASAVELGRARKLREMLDVLLLNPPSHRSAEERARSADRFAVEWDDDLGCFVAPYVMAFVNSRVVRRSNALLDQVGAGYGPRFTYREGRQTRTRRKGLQSLVWLGGLSALVGSPLGRRLIPLFTPRPGTGPDPAAQRAGFTRLRFVGVGEGGAKVHARVEYPGDPGYRTTSLLAVESALCLALDRDRRPLAGGVLTPATALGEAVVDRLRAAGVVVEVESPESGAGGLLVGRLPASSRQAPGPTRAPSASARASEAPLTGR